MKWLFIKAVMRKIGFSEIWITWIMRCKIQGAYEWSTHGLYCSRERSTSRKSFVAFHLYSMHENAR